MEPIPVEWQKLWMIENTTTNSFVRDSKTKKVIAFNTHDSAYRLLNGVLDVSIYRIIYGPPCEFFKVEDILWNAVYKGN
jgi:hypothetical protein